MTRFIDGPLSTAVQDTNMSWAFLLFLNLDNDPLYLWSGNGDVSWNGHTWMGTGDAGTLSGIGESADMSNNSLEATLNFLDADHVNEVIHMDPVGRDFEVYLAFFAGDERIINHALMLTAGVIDGVTVSDGQVGSIKLRLISEKALLSRFNSYSMDNQHQRYLFPGDSGCAYVTSLDEEIIWGPRPNSGAGIVGSSGGGRSSRTEAGDFMPDY